MTIKDRTSEYEHITRVPQFGLKLKLDHVFPEKRKPYQKARWKHLRPNLIVLFRYIFYYFVMLLKGRKPTMDFIKIPSAKPIYGAPIGGIGGGTIGRGFRGEFCRFAINPGFYEYNTVDADHFIVTIKDSKNKTTFQSLLSTYGRKRNGPLSSWKSLLNPSKCNYTALYPRAWTEFDLSEHGIKLTCRQVTPIIPHNYKDSSLPCAAFIWEIENVSNEQKSVTITFTFKNGIGDKQKDKEALCTTKTFSTSETEGVLLHQMIENNPCTYAIASKKRSGVNISKCLSFDPNSNGATVWKQLKSNGKLTEDEQECQETTGETACGIATQVVVEPKLKEIIENTLVWDMPVVSFYSKTKTFKRFYTKYFGIKDAAVKIVDYTLKNYGKWEIDIFNWQKNVLDDNELPAWYKGALFNETYFVADGGTIWFALDDSEIATLPEHDPRIKFGHFAYLEGQEYRLYNTYDVHFYSSFAITMNWPEIQNTIQYDFKQAIYKVEPEIVHFLFDGKYDARKLKNTVPHDLGQPDEEPFTFVNAYMLHSVSHWKDLNTKFVLQVFRDYCTQKFEHGLSADQYLRDMFETCEVVMQKTLEYDLDGDGVIENTGYPEQTYDTWLMTGTSSYCGGLWLASLQAMVVMCGKLNKQEEKEKYNELLKKGKVSFEKKLWNGNYYNFDCSTDPSIRNSILADQLCGHWYMRCSDSKYELYPEENVKKTLKTIYKYNVMSFCDGTLGAVNGFTTEGKIDTTANQSEEMWPGVTYAVASTMIHEGLIREAWQTAGGMYNRMTKRIGLAFNTPEAINATRVYRSMGYMRPLSIWSMQLAWEQRKNNWVIC